MTTASTAITAPTYADMLDGLVLIGASGEQWTVKSKLPRARPGATGGVFSIGYVVQSSTGTDAFLKALDLSAAFKSTDPTRELQAMTTAFNLERDILIACRNNRTDRVVLANDHGSVAIDPMFYGSIVPYIIFELAEGDVRAFVQFSGSFDSAWAFRALHEVALGMWQLHRQRIAHQDLKPSNVMVFSGEIGAKVGDLGRASKQGVSAPHEPLTVPGDKTYAPPELLYSSVSTEWGERRLGSDAYLLGSLVVSFVTGASMTSIVQRHLSHQHHWTLWRDTYANVLPFVREAFNRALADIYSQAPLEFRDDIVRIVRQLCEPDSSVRGHPRARAQKHGNPFDLERYVSEFDLLARRAERGLKRAVGAVQPGLSAGRITP